MFNHTPQNIPRHELTVISKEIKGFGGNKYYELKDRYNRIHRQYIGRDGEDSFCQPTMEYLPEE